jgi:hypothetical protein
VKTQAPAIVATNFKDDLEFHRPMLLVARQTKHGRRCHLAAQVETSPNSERNQPTCPKRCRAGNARSRRIKTRQCREGSKRPSSPTPELAASIALEARHVSCLNEMAVPVRLTSTAISVESRALYSSLYVDCMVSLYRP